ncbi:MAG: hypothetical protein NTX22_15975 [Ignavibacteriales bacterium]|nr:hypothetical protein [Ignavibacteriales bacterium]
MGIFGKGKRIFDAIGKIKGPHSFMIQGKKITCQHCGGEKFEKGSALLNTAGLTFLDLDWANRSATILICTSCTKIQWFLKEPDVTDL